MPYIECEKYIEPFTVVYENCPLLVKECADYEWLCKESNKDESGVCCSWDCPVAHPADMEDLRIIDVELYLEKIYESIKYPECWENAQRSQDGDGYIIPPYSADDELMVVYRKVDIND